MSDLKEDAVWLYVSDFDGFPIEIALQGLGQDIALITVPPHEVSQFVQREKPFAERPEVDLILLDVIPGHEGLALIPWIKESMPSPVVALCPDAAPDLLEQAYNANVDFCAVVPVVGLEELTRTMKAVHAFWLTTRLASRAPRKPPSSRTASSQPKARRR